MQKFSFGQKVATLSALSLATIAGFTPAQAYPTNWWSYSPSSSSWSYQPAASSFTPAASNSRAADPSSSTADSDGDGIPNSWETNGYDYDGDGQVDLDFPAWGANPNKKDLFVEMDYMPGLLASQSELDTIVRTFANYPVNNPDGSRGINLHLDAGDAYAKYDLGGGNEIDYQALRNEQTVGQLRQENSDPARNGIFHYMVFGDYYTDAPGSSGIAQIDGLNFAVTLGPQYWGNNVSSNTLSLIHI